ncbi:MAG: alpha/beta hydrolase [Deltaproteobacteria bacterium]|nr:alpha/beta hydrolase [Deltaproteobacteria bacterium]
MSQPQLFSARYITTPDGAELWCQLEGEGEHAVVLADGLGCDGFIWKYLEPHLAQKYRVVRFHYRGHGKSGLPRDPARLSVQHFADDLAQILDELRVPRAAIFGHSMGVQVILEFHRRHRDRVAALVPVCGSYGNVLDTWHDDTMLKRAFPILREVVERFPSLVKRVWTKILPTEMSIFIGRHFESQAEFLRREDFWPYFRHLGEMDPVAFVRTLEVASKHSAWEHLPEVDVPTLIIAGEKDRFTPVWLSERMHVHIPGSELVIVPNASHCAPLEMPGLVELAAEQFLARVFAAAPLTRRA